MNSRSLTATPAQSASAIPSPVDPVGLVVALYSCPSPPVARTTDGAWTAPMPRRSATSTPVTASVREAASCSNRSAAWLVRMSSVFAAWSSARCTSAPVASPPACTMRRRECPPSRLSAQPPAAALSNCAPSLTNSVTARKPSATMDVTASGSQSPAPAARVSATCASTESSVSGSTTAIPPWAWCVAVESGLRPALLSTTTRRPARCAASAAAKPPTPVPMTTTSALSCQAGRMLIRRRPVGRWRSSAARFAAPAARSVRQRALRRHPRPGNAATPRG